MTSCAAIPGGMSLDGVDVTRQAVIDGNVLVKEKPVRVGYARLLDPNNEFVAEVPLNSGGDFRFFTVTGEWNVQLFLPSGTFRTQVQAKIGEIVKVNIRL